MTENKSRENNSPSIKPLLIALGSVFLVGAIILGVIIAGVFVASSGEAAEACGPGSPGYVGPEPDNSLPVPGELRKQQIANAKLIDQATADLGLSGTASKIAIIAAMGESSLINLSTGDEDQGVVNPGGAATTSKGLFQQQTPWWGTEAQVTEPKYATTSFLLGPDHKGTAQGLITVDGWESGEITLVINKVQANDDKNHYAASYESANQVITEAGIDINRAADTSKQGDWGTANDTAPHTPGVIAGSPGTTGCAPGGTAPGSPGISNTEGDTYPWVSLSPPPGVYNVDPLSFYYGECTSYSAWKVNEAMGGTASNIIFNNSYGGNIKGNGGQWKAAWEASGWQVSNTPKVDSVAYWDAYGAAGIGEAGHVGWVDEITPDGKVIISEYNNSYYGPPGHKYSRRSAAIEPSEVNAYLYVPEKK